MQNKNRFVALALIGPLLAGCAAEAPISGPSLSGPSLSRQGGPSIATGGGHFTASGADVTFAFNAVQKDASGTATGQMRFSVELGGQLIEFKGRVTCMTTDPVNNRAWIGGVVTQNNSEHPSFTRDVNEVGRDIWFRVEDGGEGSKASGPDRATFVGFEGSAGIITSEEYCAAQIWEAPTEPPRTNPLTAGNVQVRS